MQIFKADSERRRVQLFLKPERERDRDREREREKKKKRETERHRERDQSSSCIYLSDQLLNHLFYVNLIQL